MGVYRRSTEQKATANSTNYAAGSWNKPADADPFLSLHHLEVAGDPDALEFHLLSSDVGAPRQMVAPSGTLVAICVSARS